MCASYGLQISAEQGLHDFDTIDERGSTAALSDWLSTFHDEKVLPTGVHARNLNPIVRERLVDDVVTRSFELAWWKLWVGGQPAKFPAINARVEGLLGSGAWSGPTKARRAIVPATHYFEKGSRFDLGGTPFGMAGIYNVAKDADGQWMLSYAIVTQPAIARFAGIHDRMPLVLPPDFYADWLDPRTTGDEALLSAALGAGAAVSDQLVASDR